MDDDFFRREYDLGPQKRDHLFLWTVFILLLTGAVLASWLGSFYVFGHPEVPRNYRILLKIHKLDPPKRFDYTAAPPGEFFTAQKIYEKYATMPDAELQQGNAGLLRDYIRNYQLTTNPVPYLVGRFTILNSRELKATDLFSPGMIAVAQGSEYPQVLVEYVYPTDAAGVQHVKGILGPGVEMPLDKTTELSAIIHIEKLDDGRLLLTAMPITYGNYTLKNGAGNFSLDPPSGLHLEGGVPLTKISMIPPSRKNFAARPSATPAEGEETASASATPTPENKQLVRVLPPLPVATPKPGASRGAPTRTPVVARITPPPQPVPIPIPPTAPIVAATPPPVLAATVTPAPVAVASPVPTPASFVQNMTPVPFITPAPAGSPEPVSSPNPVPAVVPEHPDVPLQPFIVEAQPTPAITTGAGTWRTFRPGQMPRGRLLRIPDAASLADRGVNGEQIYLSGQFTVTASGQNNAVLRAKTGVLGALNPLDHTTSSVRVFVEFPAGFQPPAEGSTITRDEMRPFKITDVRRERDGTIDVMAQEITTAQ